MGNAKYILMVSVPFLSFPPMGFGEDAKESEKEDTTIEAFAKFQYTGFGNKSLLKMTGAGFSTGVRFFVSPSSRLGTGFQFSRFSHQEEFDQFNIINEINPKSQYGTGRTLAGDIFHRLPYEAFQPYVFYGLGCVHKSHTYHFQSVPDIHKRILMAAIDIGGGIRVPVTGRFYIVPETCLLFCLLKNTDINGKTGSAMGDVGIGITYIFTKGDKRVVRWTVTGTNTGPILSTETEFPATGKSVKFSGVSVNTIVDGKIVEEWAYWDHGGVLQQLGFTLTPPSPPEQE